VSSEEDAPMSNKVAEERIGPTVAFSPRRTSARLVCEVCGEYEGECIPEYHRLHDEEQREKVRAARESEQRIAETVLAALHAGKVLPTAPEGGSIPAATQPPALAAANTPRVLIEVPEAAQIMGISEEAFYQRKARGQIPGCIVPVGDGGRFQVHREKLLAGIAKKAR
jgi:hypothetical protein